MRAPFSIIEHRNTSGKSSFTARFFDHDGSLIRSVTLRDVEGKPPRNRTAAVRLAQKILESGIVSNAQNPEMVAFLTDFWKVDSDYVVGKRARGGSISDRFVKDSAAVVKKLTPYLKGKHVADLSPDVLEKAVLDLKKKGVGVSRINSALKAVRTPVAYFCRMHRLPNALTVVSKLKETPKERGTLSADELGKLIDLEGESPRVKAAILLGGLCGMRLGEVRGLMPEDVDFEDGTICIQHNMAAMEAKLKGPKWAEYRTVPMPTAVSESLRILQALPGSRRAKFVVFNEANPINCFSIKAIEEGFYRMLEKIGIGEEERKRRNIVFHSLRHTYVSLTRAAGLPDFAVMRLSGHRSAAMLEHYSHADNIIDFESVRASIDAAVAPKEAAK